MTQPVVRHKSPQATRLRHLVERLIGDRTEIEAVLASCPSGYIKRAIAMGYDFDVHGVAWLHKGALEVWPGLVMTVRRADGYHRGIALYPNENGSGWDVSDMPVDQIRFDQIYLQA